VAQTFAKGFASVLVFSASSVWGACVYEAAAWPDPSTTMAVASCAGATFIAAFQQAARMWGPDTAFAFTVFEYRKADPCSEPRSSRFRTLVSAERICAGGWGP
jgi:hypothetical protein